MAVQLGLDPGLLRPRLALNICWVSLYIAVHVCVYGEGGGRERERERESEIGSVGHETTNQAFHDVVSCRPQWHHYV